MKIGCTRVLKKSKSRLVDEGGVAGCWAKSPVVIKRPEMTQDRVLLNTDPPYPLRDSAASVIHLHRSPRTNSFVGLLVRLRGPAGRLPLGVTPWRDPWNAWIFARYDRSMEHHKRLAILVGGGPAPGINSVIGAATIRAEL